MSEPVQQIEVLPLTNRRRYACDVIEVHSGDDLVVLVDLGIDDLYKRTRVRLAGCDTPDAYQKAVDTTAGRVREKVRRLTAGRPCQIDVHSQGRGGWKVTLWAATEDSDSLLNINKILVDDGFIFKGR
jgi:endonuclease YncB( thermonuclease family)